MTIELNRAHFPVTVLGPGRRIGLWVQGCGIGCAGCVARDTWAPDPGRAVAIGAVVAWCAGCESPDGVTISGGEPFDQPEALDELLRQLDAWRNGTGREIDLLCYSGRNLTVLRRRFPHILDRLDAVIPGPYREDEAPGGRWRGSANQELVPLTDLGRRRYAEHVDAAAGPNRLQAAVSGDTVYHIGVPLPGDLDKLEAALARRGLRYAEASWRS
jgi:anaerobic ribonucleoside-triphosphate reductase activating protein